MKRIFLFILLGISFIATSFALSSPVHEVFDNQADFEASANAKMCETATDGCNTFGMKDGKATWGTRMYCEDVYGESGTEAWSCKKFKEQAIPTMCTMEYAPVCGVNGTTYSNTCMANGAEVKIAYKGECNTYSSKSDFEASEDIKMCTSAVDGCNSFGVENGKVTWGTEMACDNHVVEWACTGYKQSDSTTPPVICSATMEYAPVCGTDSKTYSKKCEAEIAGVEIAYGGECNTKSSVLSLNDQSFYDTIKTRLAEDEQQRVYKIVDKYEGIIADMSDAKKMRLQKKFLIMIENAISELLLQYPQDIGLPEKANNLYYMLTLLKFEIQLLDE